MSAAANHFAFRRRMYPCAFDVLFYKNVPHIIEKIFFSLDYETFTSCCMVSKVWKETLTSMTFQSQRKIFHEELLKEELELLEASRWGKIGKVRRLLSTGLVDVNNMDLTNWTILGKAAAYGHKDVVDLLLSKGADPNMENTNGLSPLHRAANHGSKDVVKLLLGKGAEPNKTDRDGRTPLHWAALRNFDGVAKLLLNTGAELDKADKDGRTPLHHAAWNNHEDVVKVLLDEGAKPDKHDHCGWTPLHWAASGSKLLEAKKTKKMNYKEDDLQSEQIKLVNSAFKDAESALKKLTVPVPIKDTRINPFNVGQRSVPYGKEVECLGTSRMAYKETGTQIHIQTGSGVCCETSSRGHLVL